MDTKEIAEALAAFNETPNMPKAHKLAEMVSEFLAWANAGGGEVYTRDEALFDFYRDND